MADIIVLIIILAIIIPVVLYIIKQKKKGTVCIGCPSGGSCKGKCNCNK